MIAMRGNKALGSSRDSFRDSKNVTFQSRGSENSFRSRDSEKSVEATVFVQEIAAGLDSTPVRYIRGNLLGKGGFRRGRCCH
jgi:hypothetical protein